MHAPLISIKYCLRQTGEERTELKLVKRTDVVICPRGAQQELVFLSTLSFLAHAVVFPPQLHYVLTPKADFTGAAHAPRAAHML